MTENTFKPGDRVTVRSLKQDGTVEEELHGGRYRILVGSLSIVSRASDLSPSTRVKQASRPPAPVRRLPTSLPPRRLDLHGLTVDEAIRKLDAWLDRVVLSQLDHVKVLHGLGTGKLQGAVHSHLRTLNAVRNFKINDANPGETDVYL